MSSAGFPGSQRGTNELHAASVTLLSQCKRLTQLQLHTHSCNALSGVVEPGKEPSRTDTQENAERSRDQLHPPPFTRQMELLL